MLPRRIDLALDSVDRSACDRVLSALYEFVYRKRTGNDFSGFVFGELGDPHLLAKAMSAFRNLIVHVVCMTTQEQMVRVDAARDIALVEDVHALWNWAVRPFPHKPMSEFSPEFLAIFDLSVKAISASIDLGSPQPTARFRHRLKSLF
jgi:hypothetical protein